MSNEKDQTKILADKNIGIGMIYGAASSSIATSVYAVTTGDRSLMCLVFLEAALAVTGITKAVCAYARLNSASARPSVPNGPGV